MSACVYFLFVFAFALSANSQCISNGDCGSGDANAPGLCQAGVCQCGVGYAGALDDPQSCSLTCSPAPVPDSVEFLKSPAIDISAQAGDFVLNTILDSYLKAEPTTMAFLHPSTGFRCGIMPDLLGASQLRQAVNNDSGQCDQNITYTTDFATQVGQSCWETVPGQTEAGPQYSVTFSSYRTIVEVVQKARAPFGQTSQRRQQSETLITEEFRRQYTINVATSFRPNSAPFEVTADGRVRYRLVTIDYDLLGGAIRVVVETQVQVEAKLNNTAQNSEQSSGLATLNSLVVGDCEPSSPSGFCNQMHTMEYAVDPCSVQGANLALDVEFQCADGVTNPADCGFPGVAPGQTFLLSNMPVTYDSCARVVQYGIDAAASFLRLHDDVARTSPLSAPVTQDSVYYGRASILPSGDSVFQSVTLSSLKVWQVSSPANIDLGNQLPAAFMTLLSPAVNVNPSNPIWDFELLIEPSFFSLLEVYYLEAELQLTFANTGPLTRRIRMPIKPNELISHGRRQQGEAQQDGVASPTFRLAASAVAEEEQSNGLPVGIIAGAAAGGCALIAVVIVLAVVARKRRKEQDEQRSPDGLV